MPKKKASTERTELQLVAACLAKEPGAVEELIGRYSETIQQSIAAHMATSHSSLDQDDLYQECCLELIRNPRRILGGFPGPEGNLAAWLFIVAHRLCMRKLRSSAIRFYDRMVQRPPRELDARIAPLRETFRGEDPTEFIAALLEQMDEESRMIVQAHCGFPEFDRAKSIAEIADELGWSVSKTYRHWHEALEKLREHASSSQDLPS